MPEQIFFQCSLPRVGSTLFQNIINQNPQFYASANSGLLNMITAANYNFDNSMEFKAQDTDLMHKEFHGFCKGSLNGFYRAITDSPYVVDKSRGNFANYSLINKYYPDPKIFCFVRNMPDIFASLEKLFRNNQYRSSALVNHTKMQGTTTFKRALLWMEAFRQMMTFFMNSIENNTDKKMLFIKYETFCENPVMEMNRFYEFAGVNSFNHNYGHIEQSIKEDELMYEYKYSGMLKIGSSIEMKPSVARDVLGNDVFDWIINQYKWYNDYFGY